MGNKKNKLKRRRPRLTRTKKRNRGAVQNGQSGVLRIHSVSKIPEENNTEILNPDNNNGIVNVENNQQQDALSNIPSVKTTENVNPLDNSLFEIDPKPKVNPEPIEDISVFCLTRQKRDKIYNLLREFWRSGFRLAYISKVNNKLRSLN